jgi:predicted branched-subunit amino acid permease
MLGGTADRLKKPAGATDVRVNIPQTVPLGFGPPATSAASDAFVAGFDQRSACSERRPSVEWADAMSGRGDFLAGVRAVSPVLLGTVPFALVAGATGVGAGLAVLQTTAMSVVVFAGASQLAAIELIGRDAPVVVAVLTALVINPRLVMYSASIAPHFRGFSAARKWLGAYVLTAQAYALSVTEYAETTPEDRGRWWYYFGTAATLWVVWQVGTVAGAAAALVRGGPRTCWRRSRSGWPSCGRWGRSSEGGPPRRFPVSGPTTDRDTSSRQVDRRRRRPRCTDPVRPDPGDHAARRPPAGRVRLLPVLGARRPRLRVLGRPRIR